MNYPLARKAPEEPERSLLRKEIAEAISAGAARLPGQTVCFPRALVAQFMCRRRGIDATLIYGAAISDGLTAHVWVQDGDEGIVGCEDSGRFSILARFPAR
jgi:hypothetical protein